MLIKLSLTLVCVRKARGSVKEWKTEWQKEPDRNHQPSSIFSVVTTCCDTPPLSCLVDWSWWGAPWSHPVLVPSQSIKRWGIKDHHLEELLFVKSRSGGLILRLWASNLSCRTCEARYWTSRSSGARRNSLTAFLKLCIHATICFFPKCFLPGPTWGAPSVTDWLHHSLHHYGHFHWSGHHTQRYSDHCVPHAQAAEAAAQLRSGEHGCGWPGHSHDWRGAVCGQQRPGVLLHGKNRLRDGGLCSVLVWWVKSGAQRVK